MTTTLTGANGFLLQQTLAGLVEDFAKAHGDLAVEKIDGEEAEYDKIREALESLPFLVAKKLVVLRIPSKNKQFVENAEALLSSLGETTELILVEPKLDKRQNYYKLLKKGTDFREFGELDASALSRWLVDEAKKRGGSLSGQDANTLIDRVGANQQLLTNELNKLLLYQTDINKQTIVKLTEQTPQSTVFDLLDAVLSGNIHRAVDLYAEQRALKTEPAQIIALLAWQLHVLAVLKTAGPKDTTEIAQDARLNPYVVRKSTALAKRLTIEELLQIIKQVRLVDYRLKTESVDADEIMLHLLMQLGKL